MAESNLPENSGSSSDYLVLSAELDPRNGDSMLWPAVAVFHTTSSKCAQDTR